ncbi:hypothetical protein VTJ49DRAFT_2784 [Mycothermus thermophilus]|uniref:RSE1/DDB1/CPSF1 first beta-propeller domain-containing protein n=1 Tax=Humicola insolens TaxID=85995 RepID=A0ABR3VB20_HUMIN
MAFQTNVFRDGAWVTETVDLRSVLKGQNNDQKEFTKRDPPEPPCCGILTRTVVESNRAHQILPVRLRSPDHNDLAFIGELILDQDHFIQICELRNGRLRNVVRKNDFGSRIRNACVVGSAVIPELNDDVLAGSSSDSRIKMEDAPEGLLSFSQTGRSLGVTPLPPQMLMVALESGEIAFLFLKPGVDGRLAWVIASRTSAPDHLRLGFHLAVDPSSRYAVLAGPMDCFCVYELASYADMNDRYLSGERVRTVRSVRLLNVPGVIHKITFLYPRPGDDHHIILLIVLVKGGKSKTVIYEWELGDNLATVFSMERRSHRMPDEFRLPLLIIPLRVQSAFVAITEDKMAVCTECLHGPPKFQAVPPQPAPQTDRRRGRHRHSLWTAWARPFRLPSYGKSHDCIYLAREDGVVTFLEADEDSNLSRSTFLQPFPCNISTAFACAFDHSTDVLFLASESGPGGYWRPTEFLGVISIATTAVDFAITGGSPGRQQDPRPDESTALWQRLRHQNPGRIFVGGPGDGTNGAVTEYRYGLRANIGLDVDYGPGMKKAWLLEVHKPGFNGYLLLISLPDTTTALMVSYDFSSADVVASDRISFDLASTTLALVRSSGVIIQITSRMIVVATEDRSASYPFQDLEGLSDATILDACAVHDCVAVSAHTGPQFRIHVFKVDRSQLLLTLAFAIDIDGEVTCLALGPDYTLLAGLRQGPRTLLGLGSLHQPPSELKLVPLTDGRSASTIEGIESVVMVGDAILVGTRSGDLFVVTEGKDGVSISHEKLGTTAVDLRYNHRTGAGNPTILATCGNALVSIRLDPWGQPAGGTTKVGAIHRVWLVDASHSEDASPPVHFAAVVDVAAEDGTTSVLMISGSRLLLAELDEEPGLVPRTSSVNSTVNRLMYCQYLQCLVVGMSGSAGTALGFVRPDTGKDVGQPVDKTKKPQPNITGLGHQDDRILCLAEWNCRKDGKLWNFILVTTQSGRVIVVSVEKVPTAAPGATGSGDWAYRYWTQFRRSSQILHAPIYSALGYDEGIVYCSNADITWEALELADKRLKQLKMFTLDSPAVALRLTRPAVVVTPDPYDGSIHTTSTNATKLLALTSRDSLVALDHIDPADPESPNVELRHVDPWKRNGVDFLEVKVPNPRGDSGDGGDGGGDSIVLVADREGSVLGCWVPWQAPERECEVVFEAELPCAVRRFGTGRTRSVWERWRRDGGRDGDGQPRYGRIQATKDDAEILGVSLDGSMREFTLLRPEAWRLLRFLQNLALADKGVCPFRGVTGRDEGRAVEIEEDPEPRMDRCLEMHIDGDILKRCLDGRVLERLLAKEAHRERLVELLGALDGGRYTAGMKVVEGDDYGEYFRLAYDVLEYYLSPAF